MLFVVSVTFLTTADQDRYIGHTGVLTCNFSPSNESLLSVEWRYGDSSNFANSSRVYSYTIIDPTGSSEGHLTNRSSHTHAPGEIKLLIYNVNVTTDKGYYFCRFNGANGEDTDVGFFEPIREKPLALFL